VIICGNRTASSRGYVKDLLRPMVDFGNIRWEMQFDLKSKDFGKGK
jgi:hypothetical protein